MGLGSAPGDPRRAPVCPCHLGSSLVAVQTIQRCGVRSPDTVVKSVGSGVSPLDPPLALLGLRCRTLRGCPLICQVGAACRTVVRLKGGGSH